MPLTTLTAKTALGAYATYGANAADLVMAAADPANGNNVVMTDNCLIFVYNTGASARTLTVYSTVDPFGRTQDITAYSVGVGEFAVLGPFKLIGYVQTDGKLNLFGNNAELLIGVVNLPG